MKVDLPQTAVAEFCERWRIAEMALFGSALREDFNPASDIDVLVTFAPGADWSLLDHVRMESELAEVLGRPVDIVTRRGVERSRNPVRRQEILSSARSVYVAP
ncbi:MAG: nucleotidyltransferase domain-containing protein [Gemmatimonadota bacterium]